MQLSELPAVERDAIRFDLGANILALRVGTWGALRGRLDASAKVLALVCAFAAAVVLGGADRTWIDTASAVTVALILTSRGALLFALPAGTIRSSPCVR